MARLRKQRDSSATPPKMTNNNRVQKFRVRSKVEILSKVTPTKADTTLQGHLVEQPSATNHVFRKCKVKIARMSFATSATTSATPSSAVVAAKSAVQAPQPKTKNKMRKCRVRLRRIPLEELSLSTDSKVNTELKKATKHAIASKKPNLNRSNAKINLEKENYQNGNRTKPTPAETNAASLVLLPRSTPTTTQMRHCQVKMHRVALPQMDGGLDIDETWSNATLSKFTLTAEKRIAFQKLSLSRKSSPPETKSNPVQAKSKIVQLSIALSSEDEEMNVVSANAVHEEQMVVLSDDPYDSIQLVANKAAAPLPEKISSGKYKKKAIFSRRSAQLNRRTSAANNVYDFLSQSQTKDPDPAADIIKRLIDEGKVRVATTRRGTGRPTIKRIRNAASKKKITAERKRIVPKKKNTALTVADANPTRLPVPAASLISKDVDVVTDAADDFDFDDNYVPEADVEIAPQATNSAVERVSTATHSKPSNTSAEGTFSSLARSVLLQQTAAIKRRSNLKSLKFTSIEKRKMLEMVREFVSTPVQKKLPPPPLHTETLSPIAAAQLSSSTTGVTWQQQQQQPQQQQQQQLPKQRGNASPWRIDEDAHLPSTFNFSRNSSNGPSFSSDFIPATPKKQPRNNNNKRTTTSTHESSYVELLDDDNDEDKTPFSPQSNAQSMIYDTQHLLTPPSTTSSYTSKDSDAENLPPTDTPTTNENDINAEVFNSRRLLNPRRNLSHRSPLKAINIIDVVELQPWKTLSKVTPIPSAISTSANSCDNSVEDVESHNKLDLFGFEEFLENDEDGNRNKSPPTTHSNDQRGQQLLGVKLHELRRWRPAAEDLASAKTTANPISRVFDDDEGRPKQLCIKEMLCSTMISKPPQFDPEDDVTMDNSVIHKKNDNLACTVDSDNDVSYLFKEPDPQTTFDEQNPHRTYVRPFKRKRKVRNDFAMFLDSEESGEDEADAQTSHENDDSGENGVPGLKKKRQCNKVKISAELNTFVNEFNEMCHEVEEYELAVEKSG